MRFSIITANYNGAAFLEETILSVLDQQQPGIELEYIVIDGGSTDSSPAILAKYRDDIDHLVVEKDNGPANAINKGLALATGDVVAWLNADDLYYPGTLRRVVDCFEQDEKRSAFCFGRCPIVNEQGREIRGGITRFKEFFFPHSCRFLYQAINYISQPALFFRRSAFANIGYLREDLVAAWDYEFILRLWKKGGGRFVSGSPLAAFRWHESSISSQNFALQFQEEYEAAKVDAGKFAPQTLIHYGIRWGIVTAYSCMSVKRKMQDLRNNRGY